MSAPVSLHALWDRVDALVDAAPSFGDLCAHGLDLIAARRVRERGGPIPPEVQEEERLAAMRTLAVPVILERLRAGCDGPIMLMKGYEVALRHRDPALRRYGDVDVLVPDAERAFASLVASGFRPVGPGDDYYARRHHVRPLKLDGLPLLVEVHRRPEWVTWGRPPLVRELVDSAVPSRAGIDGILAPAPAHHALLLAAHSWSGTPLRKLVDVVDIALLAAEADGDELDSWARRWDVDGLWTFTTRVRDALLSGSPPPRAARLWARSLLRARDATVLEQHERRLLSAFSVLPFRRALGQTARALLRELLPAEGETWRTKLERSGLAIRHALVPRSRHDDVLRSRRR